MIVVFDKTKLELGISAYESIPCITKILQFFKAIVISRYERIIEFTKEFVENTKYSHFDCLHMC